jgi:hypothetical protein
MMVEQADAKANRVIPILLRTERYPVAVKWLMRQDGSRAVLSISGKDIAMQRSNTAAVTSDKTELALTIMPTGKPELPDHFALRQNFPNPFNPTTTIEYELPLRTMVTLRIYDLLGQKVATLAEEVEEGGYKRIEWDASGFPSGIYFYRINAGDFMETRKLVLLR